MGALPNRKQRRQIAKNLGFIKRRSSLSLKKYAEELYRSVEAGKEIHRLNEEEFLRNDLKLKEERIKQRIQELMSSGVDEDTAIEIAQKIFKNWNGNMDR